MSIRPEYFEYLSHFGQTIPIRELRQLSPGETAVGLRHDVDHSLNLAMEMACRENQRGYRATYYLLHTAEYWNDPFLAEKCLQLQDFGHEVGLHLNILTEWYAGKIEDPADRLRELLSPLLRAGVRIESCAAHGDRACYENQFANYWLFSELRPADPEATETGMSPEGVPAVEESRRLTYPSSHALTRADGRSFDLWSIRMADFGLTCHATHLPFDRYFTDSGGYWNRSPDPKQYDMRQGRSQVLMHPVHWRGPHKVYFFLSPARSGSKWLANFLDTATSLRAQHEFCLNHRWRNRSVWPEKHTGAGFTELLGNYKQSKILLREAAAWASTLREDYAEANIYLERFLGLLGTVFPEAEMVHLHRDPHDVVRSIMNRDWYDTPMDDRHPPVDVPGWHGLDQFHKVCWYVRDANRRLLRACNVRLRFEQVTKDMAALTRQLDSLDICVLPRLSKSAFQQRVNASQRHDFPEFQKWSLSQKACFYSICGPILKSLDYPSRTRMPMPVLGALGRVTDWLIWLRRALRRLLLWRASRTLFSAEGNALANVASATMGSLPSTEETGGLRLRPDGAGHAWLVIGASDWNRIRRGEGWKAIRNRYYDLLIEGTVSGDGNAQVLCLMYNAGGRLVDKRYLAVLSSQRPNSEAAFRLPPKVARFSVAIFANHSELPQIVNINRMLLRSLSLYGAAPVPHR